MQKSRVLDVECWQVHLTVHAFQINYLNHALLKQHNSFVGCVVEWCLELQYLRGESPNMDGRLILQRID